ncbi:hypothetical protein SAMN05421630_111178 [Prauserella marina]|uniref:Uncharacterized protein n=1 Tax=Prauserella marina TaxID=530584 RepID=A0A1G6X0F4_9PSEU|nr:hypothetical protein DES30_10995 [Prauserella marina]SDD70756.1 hypothetical protein SAMN05421630_111178 [Prauserella marina]
MTAKGPARWGLLAVLILDAVLLALLELFLLPLRLDGVLLPKLGDVPFPISVLIAVVTTPLLVALAIPLIGKRLAGVPLIAWLLTLFVVGLQGPGGDLVLVADWRAFALLAGGALPAAIVLGRGGVRVQRARQEAVSAKVR